MKNMREIKFRVFAYTDEGNKMVYLGPLECDNGLWFSSLEHHLDDYIDKIMQYTGVKDKNGKEIYEGDIIICDIYERENYDDYASGRLIKVYWDEDATGFYPLNKGSQWRSGCENIEVLGNIYENPDLLK